MASHVSLEAAASVAGTAGPSISAGHRSAITLEYLRAAAQPPDKYGHQPRLYRLAVQLAGETSFDDDILFAAAWLHDIGVFVGHRPEDPELLATWDNVAYAALEVPRLLAGFGFPAEKIDAVSEAIRTHLPSRSPATIEGQLLRDADILEQLGAVAVLRTVSKVGRDTRFPTHGEAVRSLQKAMTELPPKLYLPSAKAAAEPRVAAMRSFLESVEAETAGVF